MLKKIPEISLKSVLGGNPLGVLLRLIITSVVVGIVLDTLGVNLRNFVYRLHDLIHFFYNLGLDAVHWVVDYFLLGAIIVIPVWFLFRLTKIFPTKG